ncbi:MAG: VOC family protein [Actinomycetota bacterium]|nr:VOC family protein [Actinomycetota bacterium]
MPTITPFLWFDNNAEEAMDFYCGIFPDAKVGNVLRYGEGAALPAGSVITASFEIAGQQLMVLNGGPQFGFTEAISMFVSVDTQEEIDHYWDELMADGGSPSQCGWLKDKFGLSWQVVPTMLGGVLGDPDPEKAGRAMQAMLQMTKLDIAELQRAHDGA